MGQHDCHGDGTAFSAEDLDGFHHSQFAAADNGRCLVALCEWKNVPYRGALWKRARPRFPILGNPPRDHVRCDEPEWTAFDGHGRLRVCVFTYEAIELLNLIALTENSRFRALEGGDNTGRRKKLFELPLQLLHDVTSRIRYCITIGPWCVSNRVAKGRRLIQIILFGRQKDLGVAHKLAE